jgi:hypothetical protein
MTARGLRTGAFSALLAFTFAAHVHGDGFNLNDSASGNYTDAGTWTPANDPDDGLADTITIDSHTVTINGADDASNDTVTVSSGGTLTLTTANALAGAAVSLNGGTLAMNLGAIYNLIGGNIQVAGDSRMQISIGVNQPRITTNSSLAFTASSTLTITNTANDGNNYWLPTFDSVTMTTDGGLDLRQRNTSAYVSAQLNSLTADPGKTLSVTGNGSATILGNNTAMRGGLTLASGLTGTVTANASNSLGNGVVNINASTLNSAVAYGLGSSTNYVNAGGTLGMSINMTNAYEGATIILNGGTATMLKDVGNHGYVGGAFRVAADSTLRLNFDGVHNGGRGATNGSLAFTAAGALLTITNAGWDGEHTWVNVFTSGSVEESGTLKLVGALPLTVQFDAMAVLAGATLTQTGTRTLKINGSIGARLQGSADLLTNTTFTLLDYVSGTLDYSTSASLDTAGGLWSGSIPADNADLAVTLANNKGDVNVNTSLSFASEDGGYAVLKNLLTGTEYTLHLDLANGTANRDAVKAELQENSLWTTVADSTEGGYEVKVVFTVAVAGDYRFAWDGSAAGRLGDSLVGVKLTVPAVGSVFRIR